MAWFVGCRERNRSTAAAINGVAAGLLGLVLPATEAVIGLLGTAVPLTRKPIVPSPKPAAEPSPGYLRGS